MATSVKTIYIGKLCCPVEKPIRDLFFSLVDYRNNLFTSDDPNKIVEFYNGFENRDQLIQWMKERPKGVNYIHEVEGDKDIIVVIPTADFKGKYAKGCRENIFKGLHMVFVESGGRGDFYFNYAHNCNVGIKKAMEYNPKWIVLSNDDMYKIDDVAKLIKELKSINENEISAVYAKSSIYHTVALYVSRRGILQNLYSLSRNELYISKIMDKFELKYTIWAKENERHSKIRAFLRAIIAKKIKGSEFTNSQSFGIYSSAFVRKRSNLLFDENYVNSTEEVDISYYIKISKTPCRIINYQIGDYVGSTLGIGIKRRLKIILGDTYFINKYLETLRR